MVGWWDGLGDSDGSGLMMVNTVNTNKNGDGLGMVDALGPLGFRSHMNWDCWFSTEVWPSGHDSQTQHDQHQARDVQCHHHDVIFAQLGKV